MGMFADFMTNDVPFLPERDSPTDESVYISVNIYRQSTQQLQHVHIESDGTIKCVTDDDNAEVPSDYTTFPELLRAEWQNEGGEDLCIHAFKRTRRGRQMYKYTLHP